MYQQFYQHFLKANPGKQHFACHSHHYWPDVTRDATLAYWDDSARLVDDKWELVFGEKVPAVQQHIARILKLPDAAQIVFAPNTHEFVMRLLSCFDWSKPLTVVTTDSEFHSFHRQINRLSELNTVNVIRVPTEPFATLPERLEAAVAAQHTDLVFFSQVFFNSGVGIKDLTALVQALDKVTDAMIVVDAYHGFMAVPTDLSTIADRVFYLAGSYKYAQGGEGCCFMAVPKSSEHRPIYTGWFAEFGELAQAKQGQVQYANNGYRFAGATMDCSALYRVLAVFELYQQQELTVEKVQAYIQSLQHSFLSILDEIQHPQLNRTHLLDKQNQQQGQFLTFRFAAEDVARIAAVLKQQGIITDYRGDRLRFGFALYHNAADYNLSCLKDIG
ncbi:aminotransferase class V-fold PLP-dependent enzyme [Rheinheimera sediminis]|uniref:aminotransferase class V-fold PLP-dependent enzyme n=1 Tax=Rheinheimera sp. YQF-1 TaxID=2499626 RepID=UPI000FDCB088|nr:aminotransferase class V-fold PLP-dependent enzyme [Rheinheimera sp. YQF-1]RVT47890.1 aminotransferase class V-fold PLP-dependent enzyme [Rheinheimera sp. YQF-1]